MERKYSVQEIAAMRRSLEIIVIRPRHSYNGAEMATKIEAMLQTYMLNGTEPSELHEEANHHLERDLAAHRIVVNG